MRRMNLLILTSIVLVFLSCLGDMDFDLGMSSGSAPRNPATINLKILAPEDGNTLSEIVLVAIEATKLDSSEERVRAFVTLRVIEPHDSITNANINRALLTSFSDSLNLHLAEWDTQTSPNAHIKLYAEGNGSLFEVKTYSDTVSVQVKN